MNGDSETRKLILKQGEYRRLYSSLLQKYRGALQASTDEATSYGNDPFKEESKVLTGIFRTEALNIALGMGAAAFTLGSLRFIRSRHAISTVFGNSKAAAMKEAEEEGKRRGTDAFQKTFANVVEGMFSLWVGYRCYDFFSHSRPLATFPEKVEQSVDSVDAIAAIPLCSGRSKIAEAVCPEWIDITKQQIPAAYWKALDDGRLRDERIWKAIQTFSNNCELRLTAEGRIRRELSLPRNQAVELPARIGAEHV